MNIEIGALINFSYQSPRSHDKFPEVLVLHPNWRFYPNRAGGPPMLHGLNFNYLTDDEINLVRMIVDPTFQLKYFDAMEKKNPGMAQEFDRIIARAGAANITSPHDFYLRAIKPFIQVRGWDPYRLYDLKRLQNVRILQTPRQMTGADKFATFGVGPSRGKGKSESQIISDLAMKKAQEEKAGVKQLSPAEDNMIRRLQGNALKMFQQYKTKFSGARGPQINNRMPNFPGNQPKFMDDDDL